VLLARQQLETTYNSLIDLMGNPADIPFTDHFMAQVDYRDKEKILALEDALSISFDKRSDIARLKLEIESSDINLKYYKNQRLPRLDLEATLGANGLSGKERNIVFEGFEIETSAAHTGNYPDSLSRMSEADGYEWYAGLRFSYPLGNRSASAQFRQAGHKKRQAVYALKRLEDTTEKEIKNALVTVKRSLQRIEVARRFERLSEKTLSQEMERLKEGLSDTFRILNYQEDVIDARIRKTTAIMDFERGLAGLYKAMGTNLDRFGIELVEKK
jgi:outer membrane protein TolC